MWTFKGLGSGLKWKNYNSIKKSLHLERKQDTKKVRNIYTQR